MIVARFAPRGPLYERAKELLNACQAYWEEYQRSAERDAVVWLEGSDGQIILYTRGEYRDRIKELVEDIDEECQGGPHAP
jgi:hypothetical protein